VVEVFVTALLVGCSGGGETATSDEASEFNDADLEFVQGMITRCTA